MCAHEHAVASDRRSVVSAGTGSKGWLPSGKLGERVEGC